MNYDQTLSLYQPLLQTIAYNLVRCKQDAEDIVQETFLRYLTLKPEKIENLKAYLIKSVINNCRNHVQTLKRKKEELFSQGNLAEVMAKIKESNFAHIDLEIDLSAAMRTIMTKLEPLERAVYVLREVFEFDYETLQDTLNRKTDHCRQLFSRAKKKLQRSPDDVLDRKTARKSATEEKGWKELFRKACHLGPTDEFIFALKKDISSEKI